jgi:hypothetical protein
MLWLGIAGALPLACGDGNDDGGHGKGGGPATGGEAGAPGGASGASGRGGSVQGGSSGSSEGGEGGDEGGASGEAGAGGVGGTDETGGTAGVAGSGVAGRGMGGSGGTAGAGAGGAMAGSAGTSGSAAGGAGAGGAAAGNGGAGGITTCSGAPDPSCSCLKVTRDGNDAAAIASAGTTPFRTVEAAIDFAGTAPNVPVKVCVAGFDTCASATAYASPRMRDGVSVYGGYASSTWTRCSTKTTILSSSASGNVRFGSDVTHETVLDYFQVDPAGAPPALVTVNGSRNAVLRNLELTAGSPIGIDVLGGAEVRIENSRVSFPEESVGIRVTGSNAFIGQSVVQGPNLAQGSIAAYAVVLDGASGSRIEGSTLSATGGSDVAALRIAGNAAGVEIRGSTISATEGVTSTTAIAIDSCGGAAPVIANNPSITVTTTRRTIVDVIRSMGDCHPRIEGNALIRGSAPVGAPNVTGVRCGAANGQASECVIAGNTIYNEFPSFLPGDIGAATGVACDGGACARLADNTIQGHTGPACIRSCSVSSTGVRLEGSDALVERNRIVAGCLAGGNAKGMLVQGGGPRIQNNRIQGSAGLCNPGGLPGQVTYGLETGGGADVHSNTIDAGTIVTGATPAGVFLNTSGATFRNNIVLGGFREAGPFADPSVFEHNWAGGYLDEGTTFENGAAAINALTDMTVSGTIDGNLQFVDAAFHLGSTSVCINAGTPTGAPADDMDGETRTAPPDIGADEWSAAHDPCFGVCANGVCSASTGSPACTCNQGFQHPTGQPLVCADVNECMTNNGSCDPLTTCTNTPGGRTCGSCPPGFSGTGETGCTLIQYCASNPCQHGAACFEASGTYACDCPPGITGHDCTVVFEELSAGPGSTCGRHPDGTLSCWGTNANGEALPPPGTYLTLSRGSSFTCAIRSDATLACWGENDQGKATPPSGTFQTVSAGSYHACGIRTDGTIACWGFSGDGRTNPPTGVFQSISVGQNLSCGIRPSGAMECWGSSIPSLLTPPAGTYQSVAASRACAVTTAGALVCWAANPPTFPPGTYKSVVGGFSYVCALETSGAVTCADGTTAPGGQFESITGSETHACGLRPDDSVACWGQAAGGQASPPGRIARSLGSENNEVCATTATGTVECWGRSFPPPSGTFQSVALAQQYTCGVRTNAALSCWGGVTVTPPSGMFQAVSSGPQMACGLRTDGTVDCFGTNSYDPDPASLFDGVSVGGSRACGVRTTGAVECWGPGSPSFTSTYRSVGVGPDHVCAVRTSGPVECIGADTHGESTPPPGNFVEVVAGDTHSCGIRSNGTVACWGDDAFGQASPPGGTFDALSAGRTHTCGIRPDLSVKCWGSFVR